MLEKDSIYFMVLIQTMGLGSDHPPFFPQPPIIILCKSLTLTLKAEDVNSGSGGHEVFYTKNSE